MDLSDEHLKAFANDTAAAVAGADDAAVARLLALLGRGSPADGGSKTLPGALAWAAEKGWVGIWEPAQEGGEAVFRRSPKYRPIWRFWADVEGFTVQPKGKRTILIGESAARGHGFNGHLSPAKILEQYLAKAGVAGSEVVDLAVSGLDGRALTALVMSSLPLRPDAIVIFAGNNFNLPLWTVTIEERAALEAACRERGGEAVKRELEHRLFKRLTQGMGQLAMLAESIPVVWVIPEFNFADFSPSTRSGPPWLCGSDTQTWWQLDATARAAAASKDWKTVRETATKMVALDRGTSPTGLFLLAECERAAGRLEEARELLGQARDSLIWDDFEHSPRILGTVRRAFKAAFASSKVTVVDLGDELRPWTNTPLPGRETFIDYCHMTPKGAKIAMAATAERLAPRLGGSTKSARDHFSDSDYGVPTPRQEAVAYLLAAHSNAQCQQPRELVLHWCREALRVSPDIVPLARTILDARMHTIPPWASGRNFEQMEGAFFLDSVQWRDLRRQTPDDGCFPDALAAALDEAGGGDASKTLASLKVKRFSVAALGRVDLLGHENPFYFADRTWAWRRRKYFSAYSPVSQFGFISDQSTPMTVNITLRRPPGEPFGTAIVRVAGTEIGRIDCTSAWARHELPISPQQTNMGENTLEIAWPVALRSGADALPEAAKAFRRGLMDALIPVFGEVTTLEIRGRGSR